ncbi:MAG TPA: single-stranded DNA-binding protein [Candidatus Ornithomonoglobus intestinigallinarum]|uniref:Single-stranded DNA-binding protein n=1 Tax=Candidatus Ornithomonoglobus intestinigallinarum TaxID=2840894 RepID=A0A9D1H482_9FIRM|nr:single-stranded DNA-binding protein [Candidatus Ornithomonoglobus intestinigallinarum]
MNKVILMGRLTRDPEMRQTPTGVNVARFTIAVNRRYTSRDGQQTADFLNCVAWRQTGEFICRYFRKGSMIAVEGTLQSRSWDDKDGKRQYATEVVVDNAEFTGSKAESNTRGNDGGYGNQNYGGQSYGGGHDYGQQPAFNSAPQAGAEPNFGDGDFDEMDFANIDGSEDDLPF